MNFWDRILMLCVGFSLVLLNTTLLSTMKEGSLPQLALAFVTFYIGAYVAYKQILIVKEGGTKKDV